MAIPAGYMEVWFRIRYGGDPEPMFTHLAYIQGGPTSQAAVDAGFTAWHNAWKARYSSGVDLDGGYVLVNTDFGIVRLESSIAPVVGTNAGTMVPQNTAVLVRKSTAFGGRANRGRMYIPGPVESQVDGVGVMTPSEIAAWNTAVAALMPGGAVHTAFSFLGAAMILHQVGDQSPTQITDLSTQSRVATQRRRLRR